MMIMKAWYEELLNVTVYDGLVKGIQCLLHCGTLDISDDRLIVWTYEL